MDLLPKLLFEFAPWHTCDHSVVIESSCSLNWAIIWWRTWRRIVQIDAPSVFKGSHEFIIRPVSRSMFYWLSWFYRFYISCVTLNVNTYHLQLKFRWSFLLQDLGYDALVYDSFHWYQWEFFQFCHQIDSGRNLAIHLKVIAPSIYALESKHNLPFQASSVQVASDCNLSAFCLWILLLCRLPNYPPIPTIFFSFSHVIQPSLTFRQLLWNYRALQLSWYCV